MADKKAELTTKTLWLCTFLILAASAIVISDLNNPPSGLTGFFVSDPHEAGAVDTCMERWNCSSWKECRGEIQTRYCHDINDCMDLYEAGRAKEIIRSKRPADVRACNSSDEAGEQTEERITGYASADNEDKGFSLLLYILAGGIILGGAYASGHYRNWEIYERYLRYKNLIKSEGKDDLVGEIRKHKRVIDEKKAEYSENIRKDNMQKLNRFIRRSIDEGKSKRDIKKALRSNGWPAKFVEGYCNRYFEMDMISRRPGAGDDMESDIEEIDAKLGALR